MLRRQEPEGTLVSWVQPIGAGTLPWNLKIENKPSQSLEGRGNKLSTRDLVLCRCFCKYKKWGEHAFHSGGNSGLTVKNKQRGKPQLCFHSHTGEKRDCVSRTSVSCPMAGKGPLTLVTGAAGSNGALVYEHLSSLRSLTFLIGSSSHRLHL